MEPVAVGPLLQQPRELGRGLMRGDAATFKVGYTWENALLVVGDRYLRLTDAESKALGEYLRGFGDGMKAEHDNRHDDANYLAGWDDGAREDRSAMAPA